MYSTELSAYLMPHTVVATGDDVVRETVLTVKECTHGGQNDFSTMRHVLDSVGEQRRSTSLEEIGRSLKVI